jgi:hypothetical protein
MYSFTPDKATSGFGVSVKSGASAVTVTKVDALAAGFAVTLSFNDSNTRGGFNHGAPVRGADRCSGRA